MSENMIFTLVTVIITLILVAVWLAMIVFVYRDAKKRDITGRPRLGWLLLSLVPLFGFLAYLMTHSDEMLIPSPDSRHKQGPKARRKRKTQPLNTKKAIKRSTVTPEEYLSKVESDQSPDPGEMASEPNESEKRVTVAPDKQPSQRITAPPSMGIRVTVMRGPGTIRHPTELTFGDTLIGAVPSGQADHYITVEGDGSVSGTHAKISVTAQKLTLENLSRFGTWVNDQHLSSVGQAGQLPPDSQIRVGNTYLSLTAPGMGTNKRKSPSFYSQPTRHWGKPKDNTAAYLLVAEEGPHLNQEFFINQLPATMGRGANCEIRLNEDPQVSRQHAELYQQGQSLRVRDLGSKRGTSVNGYDIEEKALEEGDKIRLGNSLLLVKNGRSA